MSEPVASRVPGCSDKLPWRSPFGLTGTWFDPEISSLVIAVLAWDQSVAVRMPEVDACNARVVRTNEQPSLFAYEF